MCDIYTDHCRGCGIPIEMHLGDFATGPVEISVFCDKCITSYVAGAFRKMPYTVWKCKGDGPKGKFAVIALTKNAWRNRTGNHPNSSHPLLVEEKTIYGEDGA